MYDGFASRKTFSRILQQQGSTTEPAGGQGAKLLYRGVAVGPVGPVSIEQLLNICTLTNGTFLATSGIENS